MSDDATHDSLPDSQRPVTRLLTLALSDALRARSAVVEFRPHEDSGLFRWEVEGTLNTCMQVPADAHTALVGRLKALIGQAAGSPGPHSGPFVFDHEGRVVQLAVEAGPAPDGRPVATARVLSLAGEADRYT